MYISSIQIKNYKGYRDSARLDLNTGINIVVGKNNAGKTALLEALSIKFPVNPHRSLLTKPSPSRSPSPISTIDFTFILTKDELINILIDAQGNTEFKLPLPSTTDPIWSQLKLERYDDLTANRFGEWFFSHDLYKFRLQHEALSSSGDGNWRNTDKAYLSPHFERSAENDGTICHYSKFQVERFEHGISFHGHITVSGGNSRYYDDFLPQMGRFLGRYIYRFQAARIPSAPCQLGTNRTLAPDTSNLAEVLYLLQGNLELFGKYNGLVREVLPDVQQVGTHKLNESLGEVVVWHEKKAVSRDDLAFNLLESGSGVGQVLAILYVVLTAREPQTIIIDEPQGFLHPGAVRKLVEVLRYCAKDKHQLVIATHSPTVITSADPTTITLVKQEEAESVFETIDIKDVRQQQKYLGLIGSRLADVFGYDRVLWVEGETEEICFPIILRKLTDQPLLGTAILRVQHTGDFNRKDAKNVIAIYERLSQLEGGLVPPVVGFIFDKEDRSQRVMDDLKRQSRNRVQFTRKRLYENYLLNPTAIAAVVNNIKGFSRRKFNERQIRQWIDEHKRESKYFRPFKFPVENEETWTDNVHGALLLEDLFAQLSKGLVPYDKTEHSVMLTEWVVKNAPEELREISQLLIRMLINDANTL